MTHRHRDQRQRSPQWGVGSRPVTDPRDSRGPANGQTAETAAPDATDALPLDQLLETAQAERDLYLDQLQRTAAEYANYRRRTEQERTQQRLAANEQLLREFMPILHDLQRGLNTLSPEEQQSKLAVGM